MLSVGVSSHCKPSEYQLLELPRPEITDPKDVIIQVHAASVNPVDLKKAEGVFKIALKDSFPYKIGYDAAGTVVEIGTDVARFKVGDAVYVRLPESHRERCISLKPSSLSFEQAASIPLAATTAFQALRKYPGDLSGKTVLVPAACNMVVGGTGLFACQLAKNVFHAGKVITTVSTSKVPKVHELLGEGTVDEIIDYKRVDPKSVIEHGSVNFLFDTNGLAMEYLCLMRPGSGCIISISTTPSGTQLQNSAVMRLPHHPTVPLVPRLALDMMDSIRKLRARRYGVSYSYMFLEPSGEDLDILRGYVEEGRLKTVVGTTANMRDIEEVRKACQVVYSNQGGLGKVIIVVDKAGNGDV
ncbi:alcohol dehydrogenase [Paecilomyces variotii]|uniref:Alcohol dehydrogenase n=1 Tax=Byssochlamys spectabilis TaxID=264951 RepID=A0A443HVP4_BYSSP|nr:alcohol dehydrogenase [Paecilomyces variotii]RWQ95896.1 alcohol dehydrogenase [Paecilomyces variotii]